MPLPLPLAIPIPIPILIPILAWPKSVARAGSSLRSAISRNHRHHHHRSGDPEPFVFRRMHYKKIDASPTYQKYKFISLK